MDLLMILTSLGSMFPKTQLYWLINSITFSIYLMVFSLYGFFRCYHMLARSFRNLAILGNCVMFIGYLLFVFGAHGFLPTKITSYIFIGVVPFPFTILGYLCLKIISVVLKNPGYKNNYKQRALMTISMITIISILLVGIPCICISITGGVTESGKLKDIGVGFSPYFNLILSISNFCMMLNKSLENEITVTGTSIFKSSFA